MLFTIAIFLFALVWLLSVVFSDDKLVESKSLFRLLDLALAAVTLLIVCIPEGMPLVISMAMAFSVDALKKEQMLIKNLDALETSGQVIDILTGKTATLTTGDMEVARINITDRTFDANRIEANQEITQILQQAIILNNDAHMQMKGEQYKAVGSPVDVGLLNFIGAQGVAIHEKLIERENAFGLQLWIPFSSDRKIMTTAYTLQDNNNVRLVCKGAPEVIVPKCKSKIDEYARGQDFFGAGQDGEDYLANVVERDLIIGQNPASRDEGESQSDPTGLKTLTFAFKDFQIDEWNELMAANDNFNVQEPKDGSAPVDNRDQLENGLTLIGSVGLSDPLRDNIAESIDRLRESGTNVRLFSGDHQASLMSAAVKIGMVDDYRDVRNCFEGQQVLQQLKELMDETEDAQEGRGKTYKFKNPECKKRFRKELKQSVIFVYRATPELKHMFTAALRMSSAIVGVTGEGLSDARALSEANVGFTMGEDGCAAARDHADIILTDDNFITVISAIRWGRNLQDNVRKFVQFQLTVNITAMLFVISTTVIIGHSPFNTVQLLWINLVMDVLAAIAFATENPHPTDIRKERVSNKDRLVTKAMMRQILMQFTYQMIVMLLMLYVAPIAGDFEYNLFREDMRDSGSKLPTNRMLHQTFMFQVFIMMNLFNMVNCRIVDPMPDTASIEESSIEEAAVARQKPAMNIFTRPFNNFWFWIIFFAELNVQFLMVGYDFTGTLFNTTPLTFGQHMTAIGLGLGTWAVAALTRLTGPKFINAMPEFGEDEQALQDASRISNRAQSAVTFQPRNDQSDSQTKGAINDDDD